MGKRNKSNLVLRGTASVSAFLLAFTSFGSVCAESYASQVNSFLGVKTSKMVSNSDSTDTTAAYPSSYGDFTEENLKKLEADLEGKSGTLHMENYTDESTHISLEASK